MNQSHLSRHIVRVFEGVQSLGQQTTPISMSSGGTHGACSRSSLCLIVCLYMGPTLKRAAHREVFVGWLDPSVILFEISLLFLCRGHPLVSV